MLCKALRFNEKLPPYRKIGGESVHVVANKLHFDGRTVLGSNANRCQPVGVVSDKPDRDAQSILNSLSELIGQRSRRNNEKRVDGQIVYDLKCYLRLAGACRHHDHTTTCLFPTFHRLLLIRAEFMEF